VWDRGPHSRTGLSVLVAENVGWEITALTNYATETIDVFYICEIYITIYPLLMAMPAELISVVNRTTYCGEKNHAARCIE
jgi:hypothetical protein